MEHTSIWWTDLDYSTKSLGLRPVTRDAFAIVIEDDGRFKLKVRKSHPTEILPFSVAGFYSSLEQAKRAAENG